MSIVQFTSNPGHRTSCERSKRLLLSSGNITQNRVPRKLDAELGSTSSCLRNELTMAIDQSRENARIASFLPRRLLLEIGNLEIGVCAQQKLGILVFFLVEFGVSLHGDNEFEFPPCHALQFTFKPISIATKQLHDFWVLDTVKKLDGLRIIHHPRNGPVESLRSERSPNTSSKSKFRCGALETYEVKWQVVCL